MKPKDAVKRLLTLLDEYEWPEDKDRQALRLAIDACLDQIEQVEERVQIIERYVPRPYWYWWGYERPDRWVWKSRPYYDGTVITDGTTGGSYTISADANWAAMPEGDSASLAATVADRSSFIGAAASGT